MLSTLIISLFAVADASTYVGNPGVTLDADGQSDVLVWSLTFEECVTEDIESFPLRQTLTPGVGLSFDVPEGDWCEITVTLGGPPSATILTTSGDTLISDDTSTQDIEILFNQSNGVIEISHL